ncbi:MAG: HIRAN domain-containing protein [Bacteroidia bacterium]|nr:HIRAN domain-containing protein [Bacteroidia bacterium]
MKRIDFLRKLIGVASLLFIPVNLLKDKKRTWLLKFGVRGFQYYEGPALINGLRPREQLSLVREPENKFDKYAIAIHYGGRKIGFVPAERNEVLSRLMDSGTVDLGAEILSINNDSNSWEGVSACIFLKQA